MDKEIKDALESTDLSEAAADISGEQEPAKPEEKPVETPNELGQFKDEQALLEGYKNVQAFATRVSQENKDLKARLDALEERQSEVTAPVREPVIPNVEYDSLIENPAQTISQVVAAHSVSEALQEIEDECQEKGDNFNERYSYAQQVSQNPQYAHLANTATGVKKLFKMGDKLRQQQLKQSANRQLELILGEPVTDEGIDRLRGLMKDKRRRTEPKNTTDAYMPDTTTSAFRPGPDGGQPTDHDRAVAEAAEKGDMDGALEGIFKGILEETG